MAEAHREEIAKLEALYAAHPEGRVFTHLAEACRRAGELERAREILEDGLRRHPDYSSAHVVAGRVFMDLGQAEAASHAFRRVLELDRHNLVALRSLGELSERICDRVAAVGYYRDLIALDPSDDRLRLTVSRLEEELRRPGAETPAAPVEGHAAQPSAEAPAEQPTAPEPVLPQETAASLEAEGMPEAAASQEMPAIEDEGLELATAGFEPLSLGDTAEEAADEDAALQEIEIETFEIISFEAAEPVEATESDEPDAFAGLGWEIAETEPLVPIQEETWTLEITESTAASTDEEPAGGVGEPADDLSWASMGERAEAVWVDADAQGEAEPAPAPEELPSYDFGGMGAPLPAGRDDDRVDEPEDVVTATMAELYARQGFYDRAIDVYRQLIEQVPEDDRLRDRLREVEALQGVAADAAAEPEGEVAEGWEESVESMWTGGGGVAGAETTPYAWADSSPSEDVGQEVSAGDYFRSLLSWQPSGSAGREAELLELEEQDAASMELEAGAVEAQIEEWFGAPGDGGDAEDAGEARAETTEADADLEMFRSWLQSLKK